MLDIMFLGRLWCLMKHQRTPHRLECSTCAPSSLYSTDPNVSIIKYLSWLKIEFDFLGHLFGLSAHRLMSVALPTVPVAESNH